MRFFKGLSLAAALLLTTGTLTFASDADIQNFKYQTEGNMVLLESALSSYKGDTIRISPSYEIDGIEYATDLSDFQVNGSSNLKTVIFAEGITDIEHAVFNGCNAVNIYFPKSISAVDDDMLAYLDHGDEKINIYYAGTENEWNVVFQQYEAKSVSEAEWGEEKGVALADKLNALIGHGFNPDNFVFHFEASPAE